VNGDDTIAAIATAAGIGGVGIVRVSGPRAIEIVAETLGMSTLDRNVRVGWARDREGARIDQVLAFAMRGPHSFTGEDVAELHGHGGARNLEKLLAVVLARGARVAEPGEFTRRAVAFGKLDLTRAEALLAVIHAGSERGLRLAQRNLAGGLGEVVERLERRTIALLAEIEGRIDFPEDDLGSEPVLDGELTELASETAQLAAGFRHGRAVTTGIVVALVGAVNTGKSSLLNALVGRERAIVAESPGTTRDYLEVEDTWHGVSVTVVDTAGTRATDDPIEVRGIELAEERIATADVVLVVNDGRAPWDHGERYGDRALVVRSKADLEGSDEGVVVRTSARTRVGLEELKARVLVVAGVADREGSEAVFVTTARQHASIAAASEALVAASAARQEKRASEVVALELRQALRGFAELRGVEVGEKVLDAVFSQFCIGK
jgi:tRNA modification GTPase